jgi:hypothetical protein
LVLKHEELAIWAASVVPDGSMILGAHKTICIWSETVLQCVVSSEEDRCAYVVPSVYEAVVYVLPMTGCVWGVNVLSNGDVLTICADDFASVFT